ncbi:MAG: hypothetical protein Kow0010_13310 [Dehalococcoidia bacterium]
MQAVIFPTENDLKPAPETRKQRILRVITLVAWLGVLVLIALTAFTSPTVPNIVTGSAFVLLFAAINVQWLVAAWARGKHWRRFTSKMLGSAYISELYGLPNRNYLLAELRREIAASRSQGTPFTLLQISFDTLAEVKERRGEEFCRRAIAAMAELLRRITRDSDFIGYLGEGRFVVILNECTEEHAHSYLKRVPGSIAVSDGRKMYEVPVAARLYEYDMESIYATDVLAEVEHARPMTRREQRNLVTEAA